MKILFCGTVVPDLIEYQVKDISAAGNRFQNNMIRNLRELGHQVDMVSYVAMEIPGELKDELLGRNTATDGGGAETHYILREDSGMKSTIQAIKRCKETVQNLILKYDIIFCYNVFYSFFFLPRSARKFQKRSVLILADYSGAESYHSIKNKLYAHMQMRVLCHYDTVVGLSANIQKKLKQNQQFLLMEGGIDETFYNQFTEECRHNKEKVIFMYSGLLNKVTGVDILLQAVREMKGRGFELWISGKGDLEQQVIDASNSDERICYLGHMEYDEYIETLKKADVLINPRNMDLPENQNNFPSKIMDYLATGKAILSSKFVGWEKFSENIVFYDDTNSLRQEMGKYIDGQYVKNAVYDKNRHMANTYLWKKQLKSILALNA